jgi:uncharacterized membrane protein
MTRISRQPVERTPEATGTRLAGLAILPLLLGLLFFAASLTPSLIPRPWLFQGVLAGLVTAIGYMIGQLALSAWRAVELPRLSGRAARIAHGVVAVPVLALLISCRCGRRMCSGWSWLPASSSW